MGWSSGQSARSAEARTAVKRLPPAAILAGVKSRAYSSSNNPRSPDGRWEVRRYIEKDFAAYFESDTRWCIELVNTETEEVLRDFIYSEFGNSSGWEYSGADEFKFASDSSQVVVTFTDGHKETVRLPKR